MAARFFRWYLVVPVLSAVVLAAGTVIALRMIDEPEFAARPVAEYPVASRPAHETTISARYAAIPENWRPVAGMATELVGSDSARTPFAECPTIGAATGASRGDQRLPVG